MAKRPVSTEDIHPKTLLVCAYTPYNNMPSQEYYCDEFLSLVETLGLPYDEKLFMKMRNVDNNRFFTKGKLEELARFCESNEIELVVFSEILSPLQERNLEDILNCAIYDREKIILEIFKNSATTSEGKIQTEMAEIQYFKTRLTGKGKQFAQQAGFIGGKGPGETFKEEVRRTFADRLRQSQKRLNTLQKSRDVQRKQRLKKGIPLVCIIGYTNAGKSSLLNRFSRSEETLAEDKLFATLDTTTRELYLNEGKKLLISDTVGFISQLPHTLIEAFKSTLDELKYASLLLHVIDVSNPAWKTQVEVVEETLEELGVENKPILYVFNKADLLEENEEDDLFPLSHDMFPYQPQVLIHTTSKDGIAPLIAWLKEHDFKQGEVNGTAHSN